MNYKDRTIQPQSLSTFVSRHEMLTAIRLEIYDISDRGSKIILQAIAESCIALEELRLSFGTVTVATLQPLQSLKSLRILDLLDTLVEEGPDLFSSLGKFREFINISCVVLHYVSIILIIYIIAKSIRMA